MPDYQLFKALHLVAAVVWAGGTLAAALGVASAVIARQKNATVQLTALVKTVRRYDKVVTTPAMVLAWGLGIFLAVEGNWFAEAWLHLKLALVFALSAFHGVLSGTLRRWANGIQHAGAARLMAFPTAMIGATIGTLAFVVCLAVLKPF